MNYCAIPYKVLHCSTATHPGVGVPSVAVLTGAGVVAGEVVAQRVGPASVVGAALVNVCNCWQNENYSSSSVSEQQPSVHLKN